MPRNVRLILRSGTTTPSAADFDVGEPAWDKAGGKLYIKNQAGSMVQVGAGGAAASITTSTYTSSSLASGASEDFTLSLGTVYTLLTVASTYPAWVRVYGSSSARSSDTRTTPGYPYPSSGSGFFAEVVTTAAPQTITLSPTPICQGSGSTAYLRLVNADSTARVIGLTLTSITSIA